MPRRFLQKYAPDPASLRGHWLLRPFGDRLADPQLWTLHRRSVTYAFGAGLAICFIPLPVHLLSAVSIALLFRLSIPVICATTFLLNPFTAVPVYYFAYRVGAAVLPGPRQHFRFSATPHWFTHGLREVWQPFLLGCLVCAIVCGLIGWCALELLWRWQVLSRYRARHPRPAART